ncbi:hypothetical protein [Mucilaginibacter phyllosphaerae]
MRDPLQIGKYWRSLLLKWREQGHDGLTIPFIIGSQKYLPRHISRQDIEELFEDIASNNVVEVYLNYCLTINDLILGIRSGQKLKLPVRNVALNGASSNFYLSTFLDDFEPDVNSVATELTGRYQGFIDQKEYSRNDNERGDFTLDEMEFIQACFADL